MKSIRDGMSADRARAETGAEAAADEGLGFESAEEIEREIERLTRAMKKASKELDFETAAELRDRVRELRQFELFEG